MAAMLGKQGIPNHVDIWGPSWAHDWVTWRKMLPQAHRIDQVPTGGGPHEHDA
jgi:hypothetical protein